MDRNGHDGLSSMRRPCLRDSRWLLPCCVVFFALLSGASVCNSEAPYAPCDGVTCSDRGACIETDAAPRCECDEGFVPWGLSCVPEGYDADVLDSSEEEPSSDADAPDL